MRILQSLRRGSGKVYRDTTKILGLTHWLVPYENLTRKKKRKRCNVMSIVNVRDYIVALCQVNITTSLNDWKLLWIVHFLRNEGVTCETFYKVETKEVLCRRYNFLRRDFCCCFRLSVLSQFELIANMFNIGQDGRNGTVRVKVMYL